MFAFEKQRRSARLIRATANPFMARNLPHIKLAVGGPCHLREGGVSRVGRHRLVAKSPPVSWHRKGRRCMINARALLLSAIAAAVSLLCGSARAQNARLASAPVARGSDGAAEVTQTPISTVTSPAPMLQRMPRATPRPAPQGKPISVDDLLSGITLAEEQKTRLQQVRSDMRARMDRVVHDQNENADQKQAMLQGLQRLEVREVYLLLTPDQRVQVRNKIAAQRAAEQPPKDERDSRSK